MMNFVSKSLVLMHTTLCLVGMGWAITIVLQARDYGRANPEREILEYHNDGNIKVAVLYASEYDKSVAAVKEADRIRNITYVHVKPAIANMRRFEPLLPTNHLIYIAELRRLRESLDTLDVRHLKDGGTAFENPEELGDLGKPKAEDIAVPNVTKSLKVYREDLRKLIGYTDATKNLIKGENDLLQEEVRRITGDTKKISAQLTGTDEGNKYVHPGLYQLIDLEFEHQKVIKKETEDIKPHQSKAVEQARLHQMRHAQLAETLRKLQVPPVPLPVKKKM